MPAWDDYTLKDKPEDEDTLMIKDNSAANKANKRAKFSGLWNWIVDKLAAAVISNLTTSNKTVIGALNELNSNIGLIGREYSWRTYSTIQDAFSNNLSVFKDEKTVLFSCMLEGGSPFIVIAHKSDNFIHAICQTYTYPPTTIYSNDFGATWTSV